MSDLYRKKPVVIEARQFTKHNRDELADWIIDGTTPLGVTVGWSSAAPGSGDYMLIETLEGTMRAEVGDWIIKGVQGEFYPCKPDVFEQTYEPVEEGGEE